MWLYVLGYLIEKCYINLTTLLLVIIILVNFRSENKKIMKQIRSRHSIIYPIKSRS